MKHMYPTKRYPHFDKVIRFSDVKSYVCDPRKVAKHSFFPLIHYIKVSKRYSPKLINEAEKDAHRQHIKKKERDIMYAAHLDGYIYRYYADRLNQKYDEMAMDHHIDEVAIAYRDNKKGNSNIQFAREVFDFIAAHPHCYIRVGDFEHFFDRLNHAYLKKQVKDVLQTESLSQDWYKVLHSVMRYTCVDRKIVAPFYDKRSKRYFRSIKDYRKFRQSRRDAFRVNQAGVGIPQGTALSGVLANVYMIAIDEKIQQFVQSYGGLYRRYSDDTIIVIPLNEGPSVDLKALDDMLQEWIHEAYLSEQLDKTKCLFYRDGVLYDASKQDDSCACARVHAMDYLGFTFDGKEVKVRQKGIYKFERKASTAIHHARAIKRKYHLEKLPFRASILRYYFPNGYKKNQSGRRKRQSNFLGYLDRVDSEFQDRRVSCKSEKQVVKLNRKIKNAYDRASE